MGSFIRCSICGKMIQVDPWSLVLLMEDEWNGESVDPFVCSKCKIS